MPIIDEGRAEEVLEDLRNALIEADVNIDLAIAMLAKVRKRTLEDKLAPGISRADYVIKTLHDELVELLGRRSFPWEPDPNKMNVAMFVGIQGSGKTTTIAKAALYWKRRGLNPAVICADTFRPGAFVQLRQLLTPYSIEVFGEEKQKLESHKVAEIGLKQFRDKGGHHIVFVDTSGRHKEEKGLLKEMERISRAVVPDEIVLVLDATVGQNAYAQADAFNAATRIGSIILTKMDGSARGGGAISAVAATGSKIRYIGTGEKIEEFERFDPDRFVERILGMGDLKGIIERVTNAGLLDQSEDMIEAFKRGKMTIRIWKTQLESVGKLGSLSKVLSMIPGVGSNLPPGFEQTGKENIKRIVALTNSMTEEELDDDHPRKLLKQSRRERIARGSGTTQQDVQSLLTQFDATLAAMKRIRKDRNRGKGGLPGFSGKGMGGLGQE